MIAAEFKNAVSTVRIHDEYCASETAHCITRLGQIVSDSYKRRQLSYEMNGAALNAVEASNQATEVLEL